MLENINRARITNMDVTILYTSNMLGNSWPERTSTFNNLTGKVTLPFYIFSLSEKLEITDTTF